MNSLAEKNIVLGVTGGIAAYKAAALVSSLRKQGANVRVVMTEHATKFVSPLTFETLSNSQTYTAMFDSNRPFEIDHIALAKWADIIVVAPCTANVLAKLSCGIADDLLSTTLLAAQSPIVLAPAMNTHMYENPATQDNIATLKQRGIQFIEANEGLLACGDMGKGRMAEPEEILQWLCRFFEKTKDMQGIKVLVTAGPTREYIDPVRFLSNPSTGKMGYAIAQECLNRGADVTLVSGPVSLTPPAGAKVCHVETVEEMLQAVLSEFDSCNMVFKAAAVGDFRPAERKTQKIKKIGPQGLTITLEQNTDILKTLGSKKTNQFLCGFAAETNDILQNAEKKLQAKNLDMIFVNDVTGAQTGFGGNTNGGYILKKGAEPQPVPIVSKAEVAEIIVNEAMKLYHHS